MSMVLSHKRDLPGHKYRHKLASYILHHNLPIHIYGNGTIKGKYQTFKSGRIKGPFDNQREPYEEYLFTISIESSCQTQPYDFRCFFCEKHIL